MLSVGFKSTVVFVPLRVTEAACDPPLCPKVMALRRDRGRESVLEGGSVDDGVPVNVLGSKVWFPLSFRKGWPWPECSKY